MACAAALARSVLRRGLHGGAALSPRLVDLLGRACAAGHLRAGRYACVSRLVDARASLLREAAALSALGAGDAALVALARGEIEVLQTRLDALDGEIAEALSRDEQDEWDEATLEVRAGEGGGEAALFAGDLLRMYARHAADHGYALSVLEEHRDEDGGLREAVAAVKGRDLVSVLRHECGVHRVQRVPATERRGRVHTSTATVALLRADAPAPPGLRASDVRVCRTTSRGPGGQHANKTQTAVRATHVPSGLVVRAQDERSAETNMGLALARLAARLAERARGATDAARRASRRAQVGDAARSERIRTYALAECRVTDHRLRRSWHDVASFMAGRCLGEVAAGMAAQSRAARLASAEADLHRLLAGGECTALGSDVL